MPLLDELDRPGVTLVLLVTDTTEERWQRRTRSGASNQQ